MNSIRNALIVAACTLTTAGGFALAQDAAGPGSPVHHGPAENAQMPDAKSPMNPDNKMDGDKGMAGDKDMDGDKKMAKGDIIAVATGDNMEDVTTLVKAIKAAGLVETLQGPGPFTVFAPTNEAFEKLPPGTLDMLMKPENKDKLKQVLLMHVHAGQAVKAEDCKTMSLSTASGKPVMVKVADGKVMVNNATVIKTDVMASNGIIHQVDEVIMPMSADSMKPAAGGMQGGMK